MFLKDRKDITDMGLQPIDLQTMYSQMSNMARQASVSEHSLQAVQNAQNKDIVRQMEEQKNKVLEAEKQNGAASVNQNGRNAEGGADSSDKNGGSDDSREEENDKNRLKESYLGQHVDITR